jgi:hypothetical protein
MRILTLCLCLAPLACSGLSTRTLDPDPLDTDTDTDTDVSPLVSEQEVCDGLDNDLDGLIDDEDDSLLLSSATKRFADLDGDGFGDEATWILTCLPVTGFVLEAGDCDDTAPEVHPNAIEACDDLDNDCDGLIDSEDTVQFSADDPICYLDHDGDGFGDLDDPGHPSCACTLEETQLTGDCNDSDSYVHPEAVFQTIPTLAGDFDYNCDGVEEPDYVELGHCEFDSTGTACVFQPGWFSDLPECGGISGVMTDCIFNDSKGTKPATGTGGTGSTGSCSTSKAVCEPTMVREQLSCR